LLFAVHQEQARRTSQQRLETHSSNQINPFAMYQFLICLTIYARRLTLQWVLNTTMYFFKPSKLPL
jgi:hypothetical protein